MLMRKVYSVHTVKTFFCMHCCMHVSAYVCNSIKKLCYINLVMCSPSSIISEIILRDVDPVARLESFRALKLSRLESFRALKC